MPAIPAPDDTTTAPMRCSASVASSSRTVALGGTVATDVALGPEHGHDQHRVLLAWHATRRVRAPSNSLAPCVGCCPRSLRRPRLAGGGLRPAGSEPAQNGRLPDSALTTVPRGAGSPTTSPIRCVASSTPPGPRACGSSPRPRPTSRPCPDRRRSSRATATSTCRCGGGTSTASSANCGMAAVPGTSVHGWGRAGRLRGQCGRAHLLVDGVPVAAGERRPVRLRAPRVGGTLGFLAGAWHWEHA